jgi:hypothetical protein
MEAELDYLKIELIHQQLQEVQEKMKQVNT